MHVQHVTIGTASMIALLHTCKSQKPSKPPMLPELYTGKKSLIIWMDQFNSVTSGMTAMCASDRIGRSSASNIRGHSCRTISAINSGLSVAEMSKEKLQLKQLNDSIIALPQPAVA